MGKFKLSIFFKFISRLQSLTIVDLEVAIFLSKQLKISIYSSLSLHRPPCVIRKILLNRQLVTFQWVVQVVDTCSAPSVCLSLMCKIITLNFLDKKKPGDNDLWRKWWMRRWFLFILIIIASRHDVIFLETNYLCKPVIIRKYTLLLSFCTVIIC